MNESKFMTVTAALWRGLVAMTIAGLIALALPVTAHADAAATVRAKTQRMSAPTLQSTQSGWYNAGTRIPLVALVSLGAIRTVRPRTGERTTG